MANKKSPAATPPHVLIVVHREICYSDFMEFWSGMPGQLAQTVKALRHNLQKKIFTALYIAILIWPNFVSLSPVTAASSPWTQTDWVGGSGQANLTDNTKYDSASNVTTSTTGQATLTATEELSNTDFETNLTGWTQTPEATPAPFPDSTFAAESGAIAAWPLDDSTSTQGHARSVHPALNSNRNLAVNGTFDTDTGWTKGTGWTIVDGVARSDGSGGTAQLLQTQTFSTGKQYTVTYTISNYSSGLIRVYLGGSGTGTLRNANGTYTETYVANVAGGNAILFIPTGSFAGDIDNVSVKQVNLPNYTSTSPTQLLTDGNMETAGTSSWTTNNSPTVTKETSSPHGGSQHIRVARNTTNNPGIQQSVLVAGTTYRFTGYMRSDGSATPRISASTIGTLLNGTTSTAWQPFDITFTSSATGILQLNTITSTGNQYVEWDDVILSVDNYYRTGELLQDRDMEVSGTTNWVSTATLSKQTNSPHGGAQVLRLTSASGNVFFDQLVGNVGRVYRVTGYARSDGTALPLVSNAGGINLFTGTTSTSWQYFDVTMPATTSEVAKFRTSTTGYTEWDDLSITEVDTFTGALVNGATVGSTANGHLNYAANFDGTNDVINIYSTDLNSFFNPAEGTAIFWAKPSSSGVWTDSTQRYLFIMQSDASNQLYVRKQTTNNTLTIAYAAGGTSKTVNDTSAPTGWFQLAITWSKTDDQLKVYLNGAQVGSTQTGLGTWTGNLLSTANVIGAASTAGNVPWSGQMNDVRLYDRPLSASEISSLYNGNTFTRDTTRFHNGVASAKVVTDSNNNANVTQSVNVGDTNNYNLTTYAYTNGSAVTSSDVQLYYNGSAVTTNYTSAGGGWYLLSAVVTGANASRTYGVQVKSSKTVYVDDVSLSNYATSGTLTSSIFDTGQASNWGTLTFNALTPTSTTATVKVRTSNNADMSGATAFTSCSTVSSGVDLSGASCATDNQRYVQYQIGLGTSDTSVTSTFQDISIAFAPADSSPPTGGSISYTDGYYTTASVALTVSDGTDAESGINTATRTIQRQSATLSAGSCGSYGAGFSTITPTGSYPSFTDSTVTSGNCYQYRYLVSDNNGNQATYTSSNVVKVDTGTPSAPGTPSTTTPTNSTSQNWLWTAATDVISGIANYLWRTTGTSINSGSTGTNSVTTNLVQGIYTFFVKAVDNAGNQSSETSSTVTVDTTAPTTTDNTDANWHTSAVTITLTCNDSGGTACANTYYTTDGSTPTTGSTQGNSVNLSSDGQYTIKYFSTDTAGNSESVRTATNTVKIDSVDPTTPGTPTTTSPTTDSTPTWSWTASTDSGSGLASPAYTVEWSTDNTFGSGVSSDTASSNSYTHSAPLAIGTWYFRASATDTAGNQSTTSSEGSVEITAVVIPDVTAPAGLSLDSPGNNTYTTNQRPTFRWKAASDNTGVDYYELEVDNAASSDQTSGDFTIGGIPTTHESATLETNKYTLRYENFADNDDTNNYLSLTTKSSSEWGSSENNGELREGVTSWKVKAVDASGNQIEVGHRVFVDRISPQTSVVQVNDKASSNQSIATTQKRPELFGKLIDPLAGPNQPTQTSNGPKVASGPKQVEVKIEKKNGLLYSPVGMYTLNLAESYWTCVDGQITDNTLQTCDKFTVFNFTPQQDLELGTYLITLTGKDLVGNSSTASFSLQIMSASQIADVPEVEQTEEIANVPTSPTATVRPIADSSEITKVTPVIQPNAAEETAQKAQGFGKQLASAIGSGAQTFSNLLATAFIKAGEGLAFFVDSTSQMVVYAASQLGRQVTLVADGTRLLINGVGGGMNFVLNFTGNGLVALSQATSGSAQNGLAAFGRGLNATGQNIALFMNSTATQLATSAHNTSTGITTSVQNTTLSIRQSIASATIWSGQQLNGISNQFGGALMGFGSRFVTDQTQIYDVKVELLSSTSAKISWKTNHPANGKVNYGLDETYPLDIQSDEYVTDHEFTLTNLQPNTEYHFEVMSQNKTYVYDANRRFTTPAE